MRKTIFLTFIYIFLFQNIILAEMDYYKISGPDYIEINLSQSGGMGRIKFKKFVFTFTQTFQKKIVDFGPIYGDMRSYIEVQKKTRIDEKEIQQLREWIKKYKIISIKPVVNPDKKDIGAIRYSRSLMIYINSKKYNLNNYTIRKNPQLQNAFKELFNIAKEFTAVN